MAEAEGVCPEYGPLGRRSVSQSGATSWSSLVQTRMWNELGPSQHQQSRQHISNRASQDSVFSVFITFRPLETKGIDIFLLGGHAYVCKRTLRGRGGRKCPLCLTIFLCFYNASMTVSPNKTLSGTLSRKGSKCNFI